MLPRKAIKRAGKTETGARLPENAANIFVFPKMGLALQNLL